MDNIASVTAYVREILPRLASVDSNLQDAELVDIKCLSGGLVNFVYRVYLRSTRCQSTTIIVKYFPPFLSIDKSIPFSQERYFVEKSALELFTKNKAWLNSTERRARIPGLIHYEDSQHLLIMEDAGEHSCKSLLESLKKDAGVRIDPVKLAHDIKQFVDSVTRAGQVTPDSNPEFKNTAIVDVLKIYLKDVWFSQAKEMELEAELTEYLEKSNTRFLPPDYDKGQVVFTFGDLWPNSILIDQEKQLVWYIDWEAARFQTNPLSDFIQLMSNLWIMKQNDKVFDSAMITELMEQLQLVFFGDRNYDWRVKDDATRTRFILWVLSLLKEKHWEIENKRDVMLKALEEVKTD